MIKTLQFGDKQVSFSTSFAWCFIYRSQFHRDPAQVLLPVARKAAEMQDEYGAVTPREGRVSRNCSTLAGRGVQNVTPREGRVSRNLFTKKDLEDALCHAPRGACE